MTDRETLQRRIASAIARVTASRAAAEVLAEIETTHVVIERGRWERVLAWAGEVREVRITMDSATGATLADMRRVLDAHKALQPGDLARDAPAGE